MKSRITFHSYILVSLLILGLTLAACQSTTPISPTTTTAPTTTATPAPTATPIAPTPTPPIVPISLDELQSKLSVDLGSVNDRGLDFVDVAKTLRRWEIVDVASCPESDEDCRYAPLDEDGWPLSDARTVFFDYRPFGAWWSADQADCPNCQDGDFMMDMSGTYKLTFSGQATLQAAEGAVDVRNQMYDRTTNTTTADVVVKPEQGLLFMQFVNTRRTPDSATNTGIADVRLLRPGYDLDTEEIFTPGILEAVSPFSTLRFMNWVGGNNINPPFEDENNTLEWDERNRPEWRQNQGEGVAWEYVVELANLTGKNIWINIPIHASEDYIEGLARLLNDTLHKEAIIYIESSNEVWNSIFTQHTYNMLAANAEVLAGESNLNNDDTTFKGVWAQRHHVRRLVEISQIFGEVFGANAINSRVRVIHSWWIAEIKSYEAQLQWVADTYGPPSDYFYAVAATGYFGIASPTPGMSLDEMFDRLETSSEGEVAGFLRMQAVADAFDLRLALYEAGPDTSHELQWNRDTELLLKYIDLHRDPRMKDILIYTLWNNWFAHPALDVDVYTYFTLQSAYSRWGMWGLTEDISNLQTAKFQAIYDLVGMTASPPPAPMGVRAKALDDGKVQIVWDPSFMADSYTVKRSSEVGGPYVPIAENVVDYAYVDEITSVGTMYYYVVSATNARGEGRDSGEVKGP